MRPKNIPGVKIPESRWKALEGSQTRYIRMPTEVISVLLTGGTGFFGRAILAYCNSGINSNIRLSILSRDPAGFLSRYPQFTQQENLTFLQGDILQPDSLPWGQNFSHVLHAATDSTFGPQLTPLQRFSQILDGTRNILDLAKASGASRFLLTSSGGIYGTIPPDLPSIPEEWSGSPDLSDPNTAYGQAKRAAEHLCALYREAYGIETIVARCFAFVGPDLPLDVHFAIGNFIRDALYSDAITVAGDGTPLRTYLEQSDLAHWLWTLLLEGQSGETFNVGSNEVVSIASLAELIRDLLAPDKPVHILGQAMAAAKPNRYVPDISKARRLHGLDVRIPLAEAILRTAAAHQST